MKVNIRFKHHKKSPHYSMGPSTFYFDKDCSTGPVILKGEQWECPFDVKAGDVLEFATTKFSDEFDFKQYRRGKLVNGATASERVLTRRISRKHLKRWGKGTTTRKRIEAELFGSAK